MIKQYFYEPVYTGNTEYSLYHDGKIVESNIVNDWEMSAIIRRLKDDGYTFGYPDSAIESLKTMYEDSKKDYEYAVQHRIRNS